jgi:hypothetical protein
MWRSGFGLGLYEQGKSLLIVGDGNLTFSLSMAKAMKAGKIVATTYLSRNELIEAYGKEKMNKIFEELK